jgi:hypothetical protein
MVKLCHMKQFTITCSEELFSDVWNTCGQGYDQFKTGHICHASCTNRSMYVCIIQELVLMYVHAHYHEHVKIPVDVHKHELGMDMDMNMKLISSSNQNLDFNQINQSTALSFQNLYVFEAIYSLCCPPLIVGSRICTNLWYVQYSHEQCIFRCFDLFLQI